MEKDTNLGLEGLDPLSFFEEGGPKRGKQEFRVKMDGKIFFFRTADNRGRFERNPSSFLPQFGGHCAMAYGLYGGLKPGDINHYRIVGGRLYLFSSEQAMFWWEKLPVLRSWGASHYERKFRIRVKS